MNAKHTPGPWHLEKAVGTGGMDCGWTVEPQCIDFNYRGAVASISDAENIGGITKEERDANAHLIECAPELLDALKDLHAQVLFFCARYGESNFETGRATAAIVKAETTIRWEDAQ